MPPAPLKKKTLDQALATYYQAMATYQHQGVVNEEATRLAFSTLLDTLARPVGWTLVLEKKLPNRRKPDGTLQDSLKMPRGHWEAKDTKDDLDAEIRTKISAGYPLTNIIFEDTRRAVLYQNNRQVHEYDLTQRAQLADLLHTFFSYTGEQIEEFHAAVDEFQGRIPELAAGLLARIEEERADNRRFVAALDKFYELCRTALNPNISMQAIEEMLVQHLLTERLFRTVFNNPDFTRRNVIANEIEQVINALTSRSFSRDEFLRQLDYFYLAIEEAARTIQDFSEKQAFLNTVYERFFQGFSQKQADTHGIVYTPQPIVDFMCASVDAVLTQEFGKSLSAEGIRILDPCVGTGNFVVNLLRRISPLTLAHKYAHDLFCNEVMLLPYYIASLNIEHAYMERTGNYQPFEGIAFVDTLDMAKARQLTMFAEENTERVERQKQAEITVIIGNPPYNVGQINENDNNKNRKYPVVDDRLRETYIKDSSATLRMQLYDPYVRFFRWATDRLEGRDGVVCFVSNNSFVDQIAFDGMRKHLLQDFTTVYHLDLHGNVRKNPKLSGTTHNVFGIQVGVGITIAVRRSEQQERRLYYYRVPEDWRSSEKLTFLTQKEHIESIEWQALTPDKRHTWRTEGMQADFEDFIPMGTKEAKLASSQQVQTIFKTYSAGVSTQRDSVVYAFDDQALTAQIKRFIENYNAEVSRWIRAGKPKNIDGFVDYDKVKWSRNLKNELKRHRFVEFDSGLIRKSLYRPYTRMWLYFSHIIIDEQGTNGFLFPDPAASEENKAILLKVGSEVPLFALMIDAIPDRLPQSGNQCFPFYTYDEDGSNRRENITDWALAQFRAQYGEQVSKWDIFHYVYALLHHPIYRERYAENLKRDLPRLPLLGDGAAFARCVEIGGKLAALHLGYEQAPEYPLAWRVNEEHGFPSWRVEKMKLSRDKSAVVVNESLTLEGLPPACFDYRLGNRSAVEWVLDQYRVKTDRRSGITSDPNRPDDPQYIPKLVCKVVQVSVETVALVEELAAVPLGVGE
jgi:predicted helicase